MKSTERHQLKQDKFLTSLHGAYVQMEQNRRTITIALAAIVVALVAAGGYVWWREAQSARAAALLADALVIAETPVASTAEGTEGPSEEQTGSHASERVRLEAALPKFLEAAEAYPKTQPGLAARYHAATTLVALGRDEEAAARFQEVIDLAGRGLYGRVATLGLADVDVRRGQYESAINAYKTLSVDTGGDLPVDGILMQLGRAYQLAGRTPEAVQSYKRVTDEFPGSPYAADARRELEAIAPDV